MKSKFKILENMIRREVRKQINEDQSIPAYQAIVDELIANTNMNLGHSDNWTQIPMFYVNSKSQLKFTVILDHTIPSSYKFIVYFSDNESRGKVYNTIYLKTTNNSINLIGKLLTRFKLFKDKNIAITKMNNLFSTLKR